MRKRMQEQLPLMQAFVAHEHGRELAAMGEILDRIPGLLDPIERDLVGERSSLRGREGMTAEQVLRAVVIKQLNGYSYEELSFHLADSTCYRTFCQLGVFDKTPSRSTLQANIKRLSPQTMQKLQEALVGYAQKVGMEDGQRVRIDCTVTKANIHEPADSWLLWDVTRRLTTLMRRGRTYGASFHNHQRQAKCRWVAIQNAGTMEKRVPLYRDLLRMTKTTCEEALANATLLERTHSTIEHAQRLVRDLRHFEELGRRVIDQAERRVLRNESVPSPEKVVSIFEPHTDIIVKGRRSVEYGHKICLCAGASGLITDCVVEDGNPADVSLTVKMIDRHIAQFGGAPQQAALDGGFASRSNLTELKARGVKDVAFSKLCGLKVDDMVRSISTYRALRHFRAGVEGLISFLKRVVGLERCSWKGELSFQVYVLSSVMTANLLLLARHQLRT